MVAAAVTAVKYVAAIATRLPKGCEVVKESRGSRAAIQLWKVASSEGMSDIGADLDDLCDSSAMATDIADLMERTDPIGFARIGMIFAYDGGHAFEVVTDAGPAFRVTVTEMPPGGLSGV